MQMWTFACYSRRFLITGRLNTFLVFIRAINNFLTGRIVECLHLRLHTLKVHTLDSPN